MAVTDDFQRYVLEQLAELRGVTTRRMFGGVGLYHDSLFFALIDDDVLYFKVDASNREDYVGRGMKPFCPFPGQASMNYYQVPVEVLEEAVDLAAWARKSCDVALVSRESKPVAKKRAVRKAPARKASKVRNASRTRARKTKRR